jgi:hypothetical protein
MRHRAQLLVCEGVMRQPQVCKHQVCDRCGGRFGMVTHRWWGSKFCKRTCKEAYVREVTLDRDTIRRWFGYGSLARHKPWQCRLPRDESASFPGCWQEEEVDCRDAFGMIGQKGPPVPGRRARGTCTARPSSAGMFGRRHRAHLRRGMERWGIASRLWGRALKRAQASDCWK